DSSSSLEKSGIARKERDKCVVVEVPFTRKSRQRTAESRKPLKYVPSQVLILHDLPERVAHHLAVHAYRVGSAIGELEEDLLEQRGHHCVQSPCTDVLHAFVHGRGYPRDLGDAVIRKGQLGALGFHERTV